MSVYPGGGTAQERQWGGFWKGKERKRIRLSQSSQHLEVERGPHLGLSLGQWLLCHIVRLLPQL